MSGSESVPGRGMAFGPVVDSRPSPVELRSALGRGLLAGPPNWTGAREAEGDGLLNRYTAYRCIAGSNPALSARKTTPPKLWRRSSLLPVARLRSPRHAMLQPSTGPSAPRPASPSGLQKGLRAVAIGIVVNACLAAIKGIAGVLGNSAALLADAIESTSDIFTSLIVWAGLRMAERPADDNHPYGHGKYEPLAAIVVSIVLLAAAVIITVEAIRQIVTPHHSPAPFTLAVLVAVIVTKEILFRKVVKAGEDAESLAIASDAWHHRSDAITSAAAFIGILVALVGGEGYERADDIAAIVAAAIIAFNAIRLARPAVAELLDTAPSREFDDRVLANAMAEPGVVDAHKCRVRKIGFDFFVDLHVHVDGAMNVRDSHALAHRVKDRIRSGDRRIRDVLIHVEPAPEQPGDSAMRSS
jgi:cation diffusion facilitator family transporter